MRRLEETRAAAEEEEEEGVAFAAAASFRGVLSPAAAPMAVGPLASREEVEEAASGSLAEAEEARCGAWCRPNGCRALETGAWFV